MRQAPPSLYLDTGPKEAQAHATRLQHASARWFVQNRADKGMAYQVHAPYALNLPKDCRERRRIWGERIYARSAPLRRVSGRRRWR